jgi:hypothetical protein
MMEYIMYTGRDEEGGSHNVTKDTTLAFVWRD